MAQSLELEQFANVQKRERPPSDKVEIKDVEFRVTSQSFWFMDEGDG